MTLVHLFYTHMPNELLWLLRKYVKDKLKA